jgi:IS30 family transposase
MALSKPAKSFTQLKISEKAQIMAWNQEGLSSREIGKRLDRDKATVNRIIQKAKLLNSGDIPVRSTGSGRPKKMTERMLKMSEQADQKISRHDGCGLEGNCPGACHCR